MDSEGRATTSTAIRSRSQHSLTARRPSLLPAVSSGQTSEPACGHDALTHGMFTDGRGPSFEDGCSVMFGDVLADLEVPAKGFSDDIRSGLVVHCCPVVDCLT